jgi:hypothetical protein
MRPAKDMESRPFNVGVVVPRLCIAGLLIVLSLPVGVMAQTTPVDLKKVVCFLFGTVNPRQPNGDAVKSPSGSDLVLHDAPLGTSFLVAYPDERLGPGGIFVYLVTAKHVLKDYDGKFLRKAQVRLNLKTGLTAESDDVPISDDKGNLLWFQDSTDTTNEAVALPFLPDQTKFDFKAVPTSLFVTDETFVKSNISEGDRLFFIGMLPQYYGQNRNYPVVRTGTLALLTDEKIPAPTGPHHVYVAEVSGWPGNSGSPVFLQLGGVRGGSLFLGTDVRMLGILLAYNNNRISAKIDENLQYEWGTGENTGISYVLPATDLMAVLNGPAAKADRDRQIDAKPKQ